MLSVVDGLTPAARAIAVTPSASRAPATARRIAAACATAPTSRPTSITLARSPAASLRSFAPLPCTSGPLAVSVVYGAE